MVFNGIILALFVRVRSHNSFFVFVCSVYNVQDNFKTIAESIMNIYNSYLKKNITLFPIQSAVST